MRLPIPPPGHCVVVLHTAVCITGAINQTAWAECNETRTGITELGSGERDEFMALTMTGRGSLRVAPDQVVDHSELALRLLHGICLESLAIE